MNNTATASRLQPMVAILRLSALPERLTLPGAALGKAIRQGAPGKHSGARCNHAYAPNSDCALWENAASTYTPQGGGGLWTPDMPQQSAAVENAQLHRHHRECKHVLIHFTYNLPGVPPGPQTWICPCSTHRKQPAPHQTQAM